MMDGQLPLYDAEAGAVARDEAIARVDRAAEPDWRSYALQAVREAARLRPDGFTTDDVWRLIPEDVESPHEPRAMGAVMRIAHRAGWIHPTADHRPTDRVKAHRNPKRLWIGVF